MDNCRTKILLDFAKWTALSSLRSGAPIKSRAVIYPLLDSVDFSRVLLPGPAISASEFDVWHRSQTEMLCQEESRLPVGWAVKLINVYLKTAAYVGDLGRPGLREALHPPIDAGLWEGIAEKYQGHPDILTKTCFVQRIKNIETYDDYWRIIDGCREVAEDLNSSLIEVEQLWQGAATPVGMRTAKPTQLNSRSQ